MFICRHLQRPIPLDTLAPEEAHAFLRKRTERSALDSAEQTALEALAKELGYLPLALEQAAAYILAKGASFAAYLRAYQQRRLQVLEKEQPQVSHYPASVATTWGINFAAGFHRRKVDADVLRLSAFLAPDNIPYEILIQGKDLLGENLSTALAEVAEDELVLPELLAELTRYSLIRLETENRYSIHRLVQEVLHDGLTSEQRQQWLDRAVNAMNATFPSVEFKNWGWCARLVEQVQEIDRQPTTETLDLARLLNQSGYFLYERGRYGEAEPPYQQALEIKRSQLGETHPATATSLNNLAGLYYAQGRYGEAEPLFQQALEIRRSQLGDDHPDTAQGLNNLAELYRAQGRYGEAEPFYQKALEITRSQLGEDHPATATGLNNLALLYKFQERYGEAEPIYRQALAIRRSQLGADHPATANSLNNLAGLYCSQGRYGEAEPLYLQALEIRRSQLSDDHPDTASSLNNLAVLHYAQGHYGEAEPLYRQALKIRRSQLGDDHPDTASSLNNLAGLYQSQERYGEAEPLYLQALSILLNQLGKYHPTTQTVWQNFVSFLQQVMASGRTADLSDHPVTQGLLAQLP